MTHNCVNSKGLNPVQALHKKKKLKAFLKYSSYLKLSNRIKSSVPIAKLFSLSFTSEVEYIYANLLDFKGHSYCRYISIKLIYRYTIEMFTKFSNLTIE